MPATVEYSTIGTIVSPWPPSTKAVTSSTETPNSSARKWRKRAEVEHAGHADHHVVRQAGEFAQRPDHGVERVGDADDEGVRGVRLDALADRLHDLQIDAEQVVAAHARLARHAGGDDADVGAGDVGIVVACPSASRHSRRPGRPGRCRAPCPAECPRRCRTGRCRPARAWRRWWASVPPIMPAPMRAIFLRAISGAQVLFLWGPHGRLGGWRRSRPDGLRLQPPQRP